jgi:hypothetical protein
MHAISQRVDIDADLARVHARLDAVINRVFDERLQQQRRYQRVSGHFVDAPHDLEAVAEAQLLEVEILPAKLDFARDR